MVGTSWRGLRLRVVAGAIGAMVVAAGCGSAGSSSPPGSAGGATTSPAGGATEQPADGDFVVVARDFEFDPATIDVPAGTRIVVRNEGSVQHSLIADDVSAFNTTPIESGGEEVIWATVPGTYPFHCELHPDQMKGTLTIEE